MNEQRILTADMLPAKGLKNKYWLPIGFFLGVVFIVAVSDYLILGELQTNKYNLQRQINEILATDKNLKDAAANASQQISDLQQQIRNLTNVKSADLENSVDAQNNVNNNSSAYCTQSPITTEIGSEVYPINIEKYGDIGFLGELFTADDCGLARMLKIFGVDGANYTIGSDIELKNPPSKELLSLIQSIGFTKGNTCTNIKNINDCKHWTLEKTVPVKEILKLKPYAKEIYRCDCVNCG